MCTNKYCCDGHVPVELDENGRPSPGCKYTKCPECRKESRLLLFKKKYPNMGDLSKFENKIDKLEKIVEAALNFSKNGKKYLILDGDPGVGKTHLALMVLANSIGTIGVISSMELLRIFSDMARGISSETCDSFDAYNGIINTSMLLIDDMNIESRTVNQVEYFRNFLDRYRGKIVFTSNYHPDTWGFTPAIQSRLGTDTEGKENIRTVLRLTGSSYRGKK